MSSMNLDRKVRLNILFAGNAANKHDFTKLHASVFMHSIEAEADAFSWFQALFMLLVHAEIIKQYFQMFL